MSDRNPSSAVPPAPPAAITDLAEACRRFVAQAVGAELDGTQDTLPFLDHYLSEAGAARDEVLTLIAPAAGAYFGEVVRQHLGDGSWTGFDQVTDDPAALTLSLLDGHLRFRPAQAALEAVVGAPPAGAPPVLEPSAALRPVVSQALEGFGGVRADDFYRLTVRFDALLQSYAHGQAAHRRGMN